MFETVRDCSVQRYTDAHPDIHYHVTWQLSASLTMLDSLALLVLSSPVRSVQNSRWRAGEAAASMNLWAENPTEPATNITSVCDCVWNSQCKLSSYVDADTTISGGLGLGGQYGAWIQISAIKEMVYYLLFFLNIHTQYFIFHLYTSIQMSCKIKTTC